MRLVGYVRERPAIVEAEPAFAQWERIRRWAADRGHTLVAVCQDDVSGDHADPVAGLRAALAILDAGTADILVVASLEVIGDGVSGQEVVVWEVRRRGAELASTDPADTEALETGGDDERRAARDVFARLDDHLRALEGP